jgi:hypothetical protein
VKLLDGILGPASDTAGKPTARSRQWMKTL